jgi:hypothetical protein
LFSSTFGKLVHDENKIDSFNTKKVGFLLKNENYYTNSQRAWNENANTVCTNRLVSTKRIGFFVIVHLRILQIHRKTGGMSSS